MLPFSDADTVGKLLHHPNRGWDLVFECSSALTDKTFAHCDTSQAPWYLTTSQPLQSAAARHTSGTSSHATPGLQEQPLEARDGSSSLAGYPPEGAVVLTLLLSTTPD